MENNTLTHHGIKGQRWGIRRFQTKSGSLTPAGKKRYNDSDGDEKAKKKAAAKAEKAKLKAEKAKAKLEAKVAKAKAAEEAKEVEEKKAAEEAKADYESRKQQALKTGSAKDILEFKGDLTPKEMQDAYQRVQWEQNMKAISDKDMAKGKSATEKAFETIGKATDYAITATKAYNTLANIYNAFNGDGKLLPTIQTNNTNDNRSARKAEAKERKKEEEAQKKREKQEAERETKQAERAEKKKEKKASEAKTTESKKEKAAKEDEYVIYDAPYSSKKASDSRKHADYVIYDADYQDIPISNLPATLTTKGQRVVNNLLDKRK